MTELPPPASDAPVRRHAFGTEGTGTRIPARRPGGLLLLCITALGVVYGDVGTSPLYTVAEVFHGRDPTPATPANALGVASLILWVVTISVLLKYVLLVLKADNHGEGGTFALLALLRQGGGRVVAVLTPALVLAAGLLYGEGIITPAISVLSAVEGLTVATDAFEPVVVPITVGVLVALFSIQRRGTAGVGRMFGPVMLVWFVCIAALGVVQIVRHPAILAAVNPWHAVRFLGTAGTYHLVVVMGSVLLAVTGCEALFADMGHLGRRPIRIAWTALVYPSLLLNYLGQGAYVWAGGRAPEGHIFYAIVPASCLYPMVALATAATVIASQALISGAFSLTQQAIAMGLFPRLRITHTSSTHEGQVYIGTINWTLCICSVLLVILFGSSSNLAAAYGFAVSGVMLVTSITMLAIAVRVWRWPAWQAVPVFGAFAALEILFFTSASLKVLHGGWVPLLVGAVLYGVMSTWHWGRALVSRQYARIAPSCETVAQIVELKKDPKVPQMPRSVVVMSSRPVVSAQDRIPPVLHLFWLRLGALPKHVVFLTVVHENVPFHSTSRQPRFDASTFLFDEDRGSVTSVRAHYGYMEHPDVRMALARAKADAGVKVPGDPRRWLVLVGQENIIVSGVSWLGRLRLSFFRFMLRNAVPAHLYLGLGSDTHVTTEIVHLPSVS